MMWLLAKLGLIPSVDGVLKNFHRTIARLERTRQWHEGYAAECSEEIKVLETKRDDSQKESLRASAVADKLRGIVGL